MAIMAAQEAAGAAPTAAEDGAPSVQDEEMLLVIKAAQEAARASQTVVGVGTPIMKICRRGETRPLWPLRAWPERPQQWQRMGRPLDRMRRRQHSPNGRPGGG
jgi:hypothetical protein